MNKRVINILFSFCICATVFSQQNNTGIAPFKITLLNGTTYTYRELKKNTPTVLIYFSPTCDHCKALTGELMKHAKELQQKQIIMVSFVPMSEIKSFDSIHHISSTGFIKIGTEGYSFIVQKYYNVQKFPCIILYDKNMQLKKILSPLDKPEKLVKEILNL
ncbi:MAG: thioredoxin domain-containing protein [Ginsengibacter sp.]